MIAGSARRLAATGRAAIAAHIAAAEGCRLWSSIQAIDRRTTLLLVGDVDQPGRSSRRPKSGIIDGYVWDAMKDRESSPIDKTRVVWALTRFRPTDALA